MTVAVEICSVKIVLLCVRVRVRARACVSDRARLDTILYNTLEAVRIAGPCSLDCLCTPLSARELVITNQSFCALDTYDLLFESCEFVHVVKRLRMVAEAHLLPLPRHTAAARNASILQ